MKTLILKAIALGGLCALIAGAGSPVMAQDSDHHQMDHDQMDQNHMDRDHMDHGGPGGDYAHMDRDHARRELHTLHAVYFHEVKSGHYEAALRAHRKANAIRARIRAQHWDPHQNWEGNRSADRWDLEHHR